MPDTAVDKKVSHYCPGLCQERCSLQPEQRYQVVTHHPCYDGGYIHQEAEYYYGQYRHYVITSVTAIAHYLSLILFREHELVNLFSRASCRLLIRPPQRQ